MPHHIGVAKPVGNSEPSAGQDGSSAEQSRVGYCRIHNILAFDVAISTVDRTRAFGY
jgi:hypothetical protein